MFTVAPDKQTKRLLAAYSKKNFWKRRTDAMLAEFVRQYAERTWYGVLSRIPPGREWDEYRRALEVVRLGRQPIFGIRAHPSSVKKPAPVDADRTVLYVRRQKRWLGKKHPEIDVLLKFNPWTADTLPFRPKPREANITSRRGSPREVREIRKKRKRDRALWRGELKRLGVRLPPMRARARNPTREAFPDLAFNALRLEFGGGDTKATPHWRPSIYDVLSSVPKLLRSKPFRRAMLDPKFTTWRQWPHRTGRISEREAASYKEFTDRLHINV